MSYYDINLYRVPTEVLQSRYSQVCKIIADKLSTYETSDSTALLKGVRPYLCVLSLWTIVNLYVLQLVTSLTSLLSAQEGSIWSDGHTQKVFQMLLNYTVHPKPRVTYFIPCIYMTLYIVHVFLLVKEGSSSGCGLHAERGCGLWWLPSICWHGDEALQTRGWEGWCGNSHPARTGHAQRLPCQLPYSSMWWICLAMYL